MDSVNVCMQEGRIPKEWSMGLTVPIWKRKGDVYGPGKYRDIPLLSQVQNLLERDLDSMISRRVEGDFREEQQGFRKERGTAYGMYVLRQMEIIYWRYKAVWLWGSSTWKELMTQYPERW